MPELSGLARRIVRGRPMPAPPPQNDSGVTPEEMKAMTSIVAPALDAEISYRRERIAEDFRRAHGRRAARRVRRPRIHRGPRPAITVRHA